jgi:hypothetical protein
VPELLAVAAAAIPSEPRASPAARPTAMKPIVFLFFMIQSSLSFNEYSLLR